MIKCLAAYAGCFTGEELGELIQAGSMLAFEYGRLKLYQKEQALLDEYLQNQYLLDEQLQIKLDAYLNELREETEYFNNINEEVKDALMDIQDTMRAYGIHGNETISDNMHLTLAFIGEYDDLDYVKSVIESIDVRPFEIKLSGIGAFRDLWWEGLENSAPLLAVTRRLRRALTEADIPFDRKKFNPHITIVRRAKGQLSDVPEEEIDKYFGASMIVDHISLMRSDRGKS